MRSLQRPLTVYIATILLCVGLVAVPAACDQNQRQRTLHTALVSANVARDGFIAWDAARQAAIIASSSSRAEAESRLGAYRQRRDEMAAGFERVYRAIATAATQSDRPSMIRVEELARLLLAEIDALTGAP